MRATILCPTFNHGRLLECSMRSVLAQTHEDFEVFIIGDGVTPETRDTVNEVLRWDSRIGFVDRPKSVRHGEEYRHEILTGKAAGEAVFYIGDDDLWLPAHLESLLAILENNDVAHSMHVVADPAWKVAVNDVDWTEEYWREWTVNPPKNNGVALSQVGHRMDFYRSLPHGWRTTPAGEWSDHYMWKQMLALPGMRAATSGRRTALQLPSPVREEMSESERFDEMSGWLDGMLRCPQLVERYFDLQMSHLKLMYLEKEFAEANHHHHENIEKLDHQMRVEKEKTIAELNHSHLVAMENTHREWGESMEKKRRRIAALKERERDLQRRHADLKAIVRAYADLPMWFRQVGKWLGFNPQP